MKMSEVIDKVSELYRAERDDVYDLDKERTYVYRKICEANRTYGKQITVAEYRSLQNKLHHLESEIELKTQHYEGISCVREMLMDMGFDTEVE